MTQENKDLLLKDLCARLPYGVKFKHTGRHILCNILSITPIYDYDNVEYFDTYINHPKKCDICDIKPYLFPLSSMTEEQKEEFNTKSFELQLKVIDDKIMYEKATEFEVDFYNKHHLDWRGLIPMGLAIDATNKNIY